MTLAVRINPGGQAHVTSTENWKLFCEGLALDIANGTLTTNPTPAMLQALRHGGCEEFCEDHGGVAICGAHVFVCEDGHAGVIA